MRTSTSLVATWGSTSIERAMPFHGDRYLSNAGAAYFRAVNVEASVHSVFQWLCQLKVAPYSYDWIDNAGRQSPHYLMPELEHLEVGQRVMTIFKLVEFETDRHLTLVMASPSATAHFGEIVVSYVLLPLTEQYCRLVAKLLVRYPRKEPWSAMRWFLPWGDFLMMRKQLLTLKYLAENRAKQ